MPRFSLGRLAAAFALVGAIAGGTGASLATAGTSQASAAPAVAHAATATPSTVGASTTGTSTANTSNVKHATATNPLNLPSKQTCPYSALRTNILNQFDTMVGRTSTCAQVYSNAASTWTQWENPYFINYYNQPTLNWSAWATAANTKRQLVITLNLFPTGLNSSDWLDDGAAGDYVSHDIALAQNLVKAGLGNSILRIAPEMNGTWYPYSLGSTQAQWSQWITIWRKMVTAMRSVPGAHFAFDWCINYGTRALPLSEIYPGNAFVDIVGIDIYDVGTQLGTTSAQRWNTAYTEADGMKALLSFAHAHNKPVSIPEWGIAPRADQGGGDDAAFVNGIANVVRNNPVVYQSYFYHYDYATQLSGGRRALTAYRRAFGNHGNAVGWGTDSW